MKVFSHKILAEITLLDQLLLSAIERHLLFLPGIQVFIEEFL